MTLTKQVIREFVREQIRSARASGVPDAGLAEMLTQWFVGHLELGTSIGEKVQYDFECKEVE
jgi:hypothetical protein